MAFAKSAAIAALVASLPSIPAAAEQLTGPQIRELVGGELVRLKTPYGLSLPLRYRENGIVVGDISGFSLGAMMAPREEGRWWVKGNALCQKWPTWYDGRTYCFTINSLGPNRIAWVRDDGLSGTASMGR